jgi:hypothetical protein
MDDPRTASTTRTTSAVMRREFSGLIDLAEEYERPPARRPLVLPASVSVAPSAPLRQRAGPATAAAVGVIVLFVAVAIVSEVRVPWVGDRPGSVPGSETSEGTGATSEAPAVDGASASTTVPPPGSVESGTADAPSVVPADPDPAAASEAELAESSPLRVDCTPADAQWTLSEGVDGVGVTVVAVRCEGGYGLALFVPEGDPAAPAGSAALRESEGGWEVIALAVGEICAVVQGSIDPQFPSSLCT